MNLSYVVKVPARGTVRVAAPRLAGYSGPFTEAEASKAQANVPPQILAVKAAADAVFEGTLDASQQAEALARIEVEIQYDVATLLADMIQHMPDVDFCRVPAASIASALAVGGLTLAEADLGFTRLAQLTLLGLVPGTVHPEVLTRLRGL